MASIEEQEEKPSLPYGACSAYECPLHGAIADSLLGADRWLCNIHFHAHGTNWNEITLRINKRRVDVRLICALRGAMNGRLFDIRGTVEYLRNAGETALLPAESDRRSIDGKMSMRKWLYRMEKKLAMEVQSGLDQNIVTHKASPESLMEIAEKFLSGHRMPEGE